jgi:indolepyruvate ferredoxin oxidoreductase alpha subunit
MELASESTETVRGEVLLGNGAIARGLVEAGCDVITGYPGTPSSEIVPAAVRFKKMEGLNTYIEWSANEKVAFDNAYACAISGKRAAVIMKQVGLNVAADSLMSAAYTGVVGGMVIVSCDDPGPHSSQTEQDTRLFAHFAKVPVFDPSSPREAVKMIKTAFEVSERHRIPVLFRAAIRVCHAKQNIEYAPIEPSPRRTAFEKNSDRWAATPRYRYLLHNELNEKHEKIASEFETLTPFNGHDLGACAKPEGKERYPLGILAAGVPLATASDVLEAEGLAGSVPVLKLGAPYPFPEKLAGAFLDACERVLVLEETDPVIETLLRRREGILGRFSGHVPSAGELLPGAIRGILETALAETGVAKLPARETDPGLAGALKEMNLPVIRPSLCPACGHRAAFFAIRKTFPKAVFTSDIGCYTLGLNLGAVDTVLDMGAAITMASGFYQAYHQDGEERPIVATIGDSTFFHSGAAGLLSAVYNKARFLLVILDNETTAMTGMQPTPGTGTRADGTPGATIPLERLVKGCGVDWIRVEDPFNHESFRSLLKEAGEYIRAEDGGIAVLISRRPCHVNFKALRDTFKTRVEVTDECTGCRICIDRFECPGIAFDAEKEKAYIDRLWCLDCGFCTAVCPKGAIVEAGRDEED